jgi:hypothetical protein
MNRTRKLLILIFPILVIFGVFASPAQAAGKWSAVKTVSSGFPSGSYGRIQWWANDCGVDEPYVRPGSQGIIWEYGSAVDSLKMQYLIQIPNGRGGWSTRYQSSTYSTKIVNDAGGHWYRGPFYRFGGFVPPDGMRMAIKFTWGRPGATHPDINFTQAVAYC